MRKFTNQFLALFVGLFLVLSVTVVTYTASLVRDVTVESILHNVEKRGHNIASVLNEWFLQNASTAQEAVSDFQEGMRFLLEEGDSVAFLTPEGKLIYSSNSYVSSAENQANVGEIRSVLNGNLIGRSGIRENNLGQSEYRVAFPLFNKDGTLIGILRLSHQLDDVDALQRELMRSIIGFSLLGLVLASLIVWYLTRKMATPLKEMEESIERITTGNYTEQYFDYSHPEFNALGHSINKLANRLQEKNEAIFETNERLAALMDQLVIGVVLLDSEKRVQMANPAAQRILGYGEEQIIKHSFLEMFKSYGLVQVIQQTFSDHRNHHEELYLYFPEERILDVNTIVLSEEKGMQVLVLLYDITQIRRLEKVRTDFVTNASHELRTPITALKGFAETLLDGAKDDPQTLEQFLTIIHNEANRLEILVNDILELSKAEQKQVPLQHEQVDLNEAVRTCFQLVNQRVEEKELSLRLVTPLPDPLIIEGDKSRVQQVISNLIYNAVNYTDKGGKITVMLEKEEDMAVIHVADTGIGIPEEDLARIFERFYRVDKARSRNSGGTGLGLSIVRYLVQNLNGTITVNSTLGMGSTFTVRLPLHGVKGRELEDPL